MSAHPLSHHEILRHAAPFVRQARRVDLGATDRMARRLAFQTVHIELPAEAGEPDVGPLGDTLILDCADTDRYELVRVLREPGGLEARWLAQGPDPAELLQRLQALPGREPFEVGEGWRLACSGVVGPDGVPVLTRAVARVGALQLEMAVLRVPGVPADLTLSAADGELIDLPDDLLSVLGWGWSRLTRRAAGWTSTVRLRRREPLRTADARARLRDAARHLAATLAEPPLRFHERQRGARWRVSLRRTIPLLTCLSLFAAVATVPQMDLSPNSVIRMLIFHAPPLLLMAFFCMQEMPRIELPRWPRAPASPAWWRSAPTEVDQNRSIQREARGGGS